jgi:hypothetical protein
VLCHNSGWSDKLNTQRAGGTSVTMLLGESKEITVADVLAAKPNAPSQIARRCLGHLVRKSEGDWDPTLDAVPALTVNDLKHFGLWSRGVLFALPFELGGRQMVSACYVPYRELKTSLSSVVALAKKR